ncbi:lamin tail domain-containing protein [Planctomycetota bacterium]
MKQVVIVCLSVFFISGIAYSDVWLGSHEHVIISEIGASNDGTIADEDGNTPDWIELYNPTSTAINLEGWSLTTDRDQSEKWSCPAVEINSNEFLLIYASGKNRNDPVSELHTNFKLDVDGEYLALVNNEAEVVYSFDPDFGLQYTDVSFGLEQTANPSVETGTHVYFTTPTPGTLNGQGQLGFVEDTEFDMDRGFYDNPFHVTITSKTKGSYIIYTLDGTEPSWTNGTVVAAPSPDAIPAATVYVSTTTVLRAAAFKENYYASNTDTHTYIFLDDVVASSVMDTSITQNPNYAPYMRQALTDLPTISIVDPSYHLDELVRSGPYPEWTYDEFPISFEVLTPDGALSLQEDAGAGRYGGHFYDREGGNYPWEKWSYRIAFRKEYGAATLKAPLFEGFDNGIPAAETFDQLEIRSGSHDMSQRGFYMSGALTTDTMLEMGNLNPHTRFVHVYINGTYWGQYNLHERWNAAMVAEYEGGEKEDYEAIKANNSGQQNFATGEPYDGDGTAWANTLAVSNSYEQVKTWVDIQSYVDFMLMFMFGESESEFRAVGSNTEEGVGFLFWLRDPDGYTGRNRNFERTGNPGPGNIFGNLVNEGHSEFMTYLADRIHRHFFNGGGLTAAAMTEKLLERCNQVEVAFYAEAARWGYRTPSSWASARDACVNGHLSTKPQHMLDNFMARGLYPNVVAPVFSVNEVYQHGGMVNAGDAVSMSASSGTIYYTLNGDDPRLLLQTDPPTHSDLIPRGGVWKYLDDGSDQGMVWRELSFDDDSWASGPAELGYGDGGETTIVSYGPNSGSKYTTTYFRHTFNLTEDPSQFTALSASLRRDDGAVVYLNGTEIIRSGMDAGTVTYTTFASNTSSGSDESAYHTTPDIDSELLVTGDNIIAVEVHQKSFTSSDISFDFELTATTDSGGSSGGEVGVNGDEYTGPVPLTKSTHVKARTLDGTAWSALNEAVYAVGDIVGSLRITELMVHSVDPNSEFIELKNIGPEAVNLNLVEFAKGVDFIFPDIELAADEMVVVVQYTAAFSAAYPDFIGLIAGEYSGSLDNDGERLLLQDAIGAVVHDFKFKDGWHDITDGGGFTLNVIDPTNTDLLLYGEKDSWRASTHPGGSPGADDNGLNPGDILINEVLAHSEAWPNDMIELYNASGGEINISGWYLSDNDDDDPNLMKYRIPDGTTIEDNDYVVFTQDEHFGLLSLDPGRLIPFALSQNGDKVCLTSAAGDVLTGYRETESFGASETGVTLGRYYKANTESTNFVAMSAPTMGYENAYPLVGPIVISEIMYHPQVGGDFDKDEYEYIELTNTTDSTVSLYDDGLSLGWTFTDGVDYTFPSGTTIAPHDRLIIARNTAAFEHRYGFSTGVLGPFENGASLKNSGERLQLGKPGDIGGQYIRIDRVTYSDGSHPDDGTDPWPIEPDGNGQSLTRKVLTDYGNDPANWEGQAPSP